MAIQVPYLPEEAIERDAEDLLAEFAQARGLTLTPPIPIDDIVEKHLELRIDFDDLHDTLKIPQLGRQPDIFGALWVDTREICIHQNLDPDAHPAQEGRYRFTLAHEGGHWRLHRSYLTTNLAQISLLDASPNPSVICRSSEAKEPVEWQADYFAACLLMPRTLVWAAWNEELGMDCPLEYDLLEEISIAQRPDSERLSSIQEALRQNPKSEPTGLYDAVVRRFASIFKVSTQAMRIRLEKLGLLREA